MIKMSLSFNVKEEPAGVFCVSQHIQVDPDHYTWALIGMGPTKESALLSAKLFFDGCIETLTKYRTDIIGTTS